MVWWGKVEDNELIKWRMIFLKCMSDEVDCGCHLDNLEQNGGNKEKLSSSKIFKDYRKNVRNLKVFAMFTFLENSEEISRECFCDIHSYFYSVNFHETEPTTIEGALEKKENPLIFENRRKDEAIGIAKRHDDLVHRYPKLFPDGIPSFRKKVIIQTFFIFLKYFNFIFL